MTLQILQKNPPKKQKTIHPTSLMNKLLQRLDLHRTWCCQSSSLWLQGPAAPSWAIGWRKFQSSCNRCNGPHWVYPASPPAGSPDHLELWQATTGTSQRTTVTLNITVNVGINSNEIQRQELFYNILFHVYAFPHCSIHFYDIKSLCYIWKKSIVFPVTEKENNVYFTFIVLLPKWI